MATHRIQEMSVLLGITNFLVLQMGTSCMVTVEQLGAIVNPLAVYNYDRPGPAQPGCVANLAIEEFHHCQKCNTFFGHHAAQFCTF